MTSRTTFLAAAAVLAIAVGYTAIADSYAVFLIATISLTAIACIGLNVLLGLAGQISLGHIGFMAIGAYTTVLLMEKAGWPRMGRITMRSSTVPNRPMAAMLASTATQKGKPSTVISAF